MATLGQLTAARDALSTARVQGVREVRDSNGESISYKSDSEMVAALSALDSEITKLTQGQPARRIMFTTSKGLL